VTAARIDKGGARGFMTLGHRNCPRGMTLQEVVVGAVIRPGFDGGFVTRKMRTWREEAMTYDKGIEVPSGVS